jgi:DNA polymerase-3 subunit delta'
MSGEPPELPWLAGACASLRRARASGRFPSALLIHEQIGAGGEWLARFAARTALCREPDAPCGACVDCRRAAGGTHPDLQWLAPPEDSNYIRVEQVRDLCAELALSSHGAGASVAVIAPADAMNANAANALLKTLEEPRAGVTLVLVSAVPSRLPATVRSRCQRLSAPAPGRPQCLAWLREQGGERDWEAVLDLIGNAPLAALRVDAAALVRLRDDTARALDEAARGNLDIPRTGESWARAADYGLRLACLENWLTVRLERAARAAGQTAQLGASAHLPSRHSALNMKTLVRALERLYELRQLGATSINKALALEQLLWELAPVPQQRAARSGLAR